VVVRLPHSPEVEGALVNRDGVAAASWTLGVDAVDDSFTARASDNNRWVVLWLVLATAAVVGGIALVIAGFRAGGRSTGGRSTDGVRSPSSSPPAATSPPAASSRQAEPQRSAGAVVRPEPRRRSE
ncbi:MAG: hypothetical protein GX868_16620, partial [Actinobacteria bacterium]|nr:hypothetical protein [Actinomycetota bacterium]